MTSVLCSPPHPEPTFDQAMTWWSRMRRPATFPGVPGHPWQATVLWNTGLLFCPTPRNYPNTEPTYPKPCLRMGGTHRSPGYFRELEGYELDALQIEFSVGPAFHVPDRLDNTTGEVAQELIEGRMPVIVSRLAHGGLRWTQTVFSRLLEGDVATTGAEPLFTEIRWTAHNPTRRPLAAQLACHLNQPHMALGYKILLMDAAQPYLREVEWRAPLLLDDRAKARLAVSELDGWTTAYHGTLPEAEAGRAKLPLAKMGLNHDVLLFRRPIPAGKTCALRLIVPFFAVERDVLERASRTGFPAARRRTQSYWRNQFAASGHIRTPNPVVNDSFDAYLYHAMIATGRKPRCGHWILKTSPNNYESLWGAHASIAAFSMDLRNQHAWSRKIYETFLANQGPVGTTLLDLFGHNRARESEGYSNHPGFLGNIDGHMAVLWVFYHGWTLWAIGQHARLTGDWPWLASHADRLALACEWIVEQLRRTRRRAARGEKALAYGLLPAGNAFDWGFGHMYWSDAHTYRGFKEIAACLRRVGHSQADRYLAEAEAYRRDIVTSVTRARDAAKPMPLANGQTIPYVPMSPETLDYFQPDWAYVACGPLNLAWAGVVPHDHELVTQILAYLDAGRPLGKWQKDKKKFEGWDSGGRVPADEDFIECTRPRKGRCYHWRHKMTYEPGWMPQAFVFRGRDDISSYLEFLYSELSHGGQHVNLRSPIEQRDGVPWCQPGDATALWLIRDMLVREEGDTLLLAGTCPREWLKHGETLAATGLPTHFGKVGFTVRSQIARGRIHATFDFAFREPPRQIRLRLRHPQGRLPRAVRINGRKTTQSGCEWIALTPAARTLAITY